MFSRKIKAIFPLTPWHSTDSEVHIKFMYINFPTTNVSTLAIVCNKKIVFFRILKASIISQPKPAAEES